MQESVQTLLSALNELWNSFVKQVPQLVLALLLLLIAAGVVRLTQAGLKKILGRTKSLRPSLEQLILKFARWGVWVAALLVAAVVAFPGFRLSQVLATAGLASVAIGFAFKDIFENFFAGILLLWNFPFEPGDFIELEEEGILGRVEDVQIRMTLLRKPTGELILLPNSTVYKKPVRVLTSEDRRRLSITVGVAYGELIPEARRVITEAVKRCRTVDGHHPIEVFACAFGNSSIDFEVAWWTSPTPLEERRSRDEVVQAVKLALDDAGIEIPFPYRTLTFKGPIGVRSTEGEETSRDAA